MSIFNLFHSRKSGSDRPSDWVHTIFCLLMAALPFVIAIFMLTEEPKDPDTPDDDAGASWIKTSLGYYDTGNFNAAAHYMERGCGKGYHAVCLFRGLMYLDGTSPDYHKESAREDAAVFFEKGCRSINTPLCYLIKEYTGEPGQQNEQQIMTEIWMVGCVSGQGASCGRAAGILYEGGLFQEAHNVANIGCSMQDTQSCQYRKQAEDKLLSLKSSAE